MGRGDRRFVATDRLEDTVNIKEFAALRVGDKIENHATGTISVGEVVETTSSGVRVVWGPRHDRETRFFYGVVGTAWMNWNKHDAKTHVEKPSQDVF